MTTMQLQWYPGHMTKARRNMQQDMKLVDLVIELLDARIPLSSRNPDIDKLAANKLRMVLLNKADLADEQQNRQWVAYFKRQGIVAVVLDSRNRSQMKQVLQTIMDTCKEKIERDRRRGILNRPIRAMVVGIPNVGKSTFINSFAGKSVAKTGNKPGVTKGNQWIRIHAQVELLDTPGILWPKFEDPLVGMNLAYIGSINDEIIQREELAVALIDTVRKLAPTAFSERYHVAVEDIPAFEVLQNIAVARACLQKGGIPDTEKMARMLLDDFRGGRLGRISLEQAPKD